MSCFQLCPHPLHPLLPSLVPWGNTFISSLVAPWVKYPLLSLQQPRLLLWCMFSPWPGNFHMLQARPKKRMYVVLLFRFYFFHLAMYLREFSR